MEKKCKHCAMMIPKAAKICPHCRKKQGWTMPAKIVMGLIIFSAFIPLLGRKADDPPINKPISPQTVSPATQQPVAPRQQGLVLLESNWEMSEHNMRYIYGTVKNDSSKRYKYAQISFNLYDADNAQIGSAWTNINNLEPNGIWKFRAVVMEKRATSYKYADSSAW